MADDAVVLLGMLRLSEQGTACALRDRVPLSLLCCVFALLDARSHCGLARAAHHFGRASRLPEASCHDVAVKWCQPTARLKQCVQSQRPRIVRMEGRAVRGFTRAVCAWLAPVTQLHTLRIRPMPLHDLQDLSALVSLRHLLIDAPNTASLGMALHACGPRLQTLRVSRVDALNISADISVYVGDLEARTTVAKQLAACTELESLGLQEVFHMSDVVGSLCRIPLPALRCLSVVQAGSTTDDFSHLSMHTNLTRLCHHVDSPPATRSKWPALPNLRVLDLGSSEFSHDHEAMCRAFPLLGSLRMASDSPLQLACFASLVELTIVVPSCLGWHYFADQVARLLQACTRLVRLGVQSFRDTHDKPECEWSMPHVSALTLCLLPCAYPRIRAPALRSLRILDAPPETLAQIVSDSALLETVECFTPCRQVPDGALAAALATAVGRTAGRVRVTHRSAPMDLGSAYCDRSLAPTDNWS